MSSAVRKGNQFNAFEVNGGTVSPVIDKALIKKYLTDPKFKSSIDLLHRTTGKLPMIKAMAHDSKKYGYMIRAAEREVNKASSIINGEVKEVLQQSGGE